jgi:cytochrome c peroxidase
MKTSTVILSLILAASLACDEKSSGPASEPSASASSAPAPSASAAPEPKVELPAAPPLAAAPLGLPAEMDTPADNPMTPEKVWLGERLFFDKRLSKDGAFSCETCHVHEKGWTDGLAFSKKADGGMNTRNTPSLYNVGYLKSWYWEGRAPTLEKQVTAAWKGQMGTEDQAIIAKKLAEIPVYKAAFDRAFHAAPSADNVAAALASFVRTLRSGDSPWDKHEKGDKDAVDAEVVAGQALFTGKAKCALCHAPPTYFDTLFHNVGVGYGADGAAGDVGRFKITSDVKDTGAFKTPGLRSVSKTGPYFHDGSVATLEEAVKLMVAGGKKNANMDPKLTPVKLTDKEVGQLVAFIKSLDSSEAFEKPTLP